jgi:hypothetical protein
MDCMAGQGKREKREKYKSGQREKNKEISLQKRKIMVI